ncbi:hypothetical protein [Xanthobacter agilis]|uniref:Uncharacterized protein n=1 Tax=Xanthobacter agilis TaxID=47492 RepID=A0ABU0LJR1_XANAG|nr:hypothetical protein [Xanthobacter agilis]MDQ0507332.1 hypothetical protein [Xanthobacter agilis]
MATYALELAQLKSANTLEDIVSIVSRFSANSNGAGAILYSCKVNRMSAHHLALSLYDSYKMKGIEVGIIDKTARGVFLANEDVDMQIK